MAGNGYVDERGEYALEGCSIVLRGVGGAFELVPTSLLRPGFTDEPHNLVRVTVRLRADSFVAELRLDFLLAAFHPLKADLEAWQAGTSDGWEFPSPRIVVCLEPRCRCAISKGGPGPSDWRMDCELSEGSDDGRKTLQVRMPFDASCISITLHELADFLFACQQANRD
jgi:hypothetical protein